LIVLQYNNMLCFTLGGLPRAGFVLYIYSNNRMSKCKEQSRRGASHPMRSATINIIPSNMA